MVDRLIKGGSHVCPGGEHLRGGEVHPPEAEPDASANAPGGGATAGTTYDLYQVGFDASWELDVFGGNRRRVEAAEASLEATQFDWATVLVTLLGEVGSNYVTYRSLQQRIRIANDNVKTQQDTLALTRKLFAAGLATDFDVARAQSQVATTKSIIPLLTAQAHEVMHFLGVLLGEEPMTLSQELAQFYWKQIYPLRRTSNFPWYWSAECRDGGKLDLRPKSHAWPS